MVGTPGIDTATATAFQNASTSVGKIGAAIMDVAQADYSARMQEENRIRSEQRAAAKALDTMKKETEVGGTLATYGVGLQTADSELRQQHYQNTDGALANWDDKANKLEEETLKNIQDPTLALMTKKALQTKRASEREQFAGFINSRVPDIAKQNTDKIGDALRISVNDPTLTADDVLGRINEFYVNPVNEKAFYNVYGEGADAQKRKFASEAARNYMAQVANTGGFDELTSLIKDKRFDSIVEGTDKEQFYSRQRSIANDVKQAQRHEEVVTQQANDLTALVDLTDNPTGSIAGASPQKIQGVLNSNASPGLKARIAPQLGKAKLNQTKVANDGLVLRDFGGAVKRANQLHDDIISTQASLYDPKKGTWLLHGDAQVAKFKELQNKIDKYTTAYQDVTALAGSLQSQDAKNAAMGHVLKAKNDVQFMQSYLQKNPAAIQAQSQKNTVFQAVGAPDVKYSNPQQQQLYNYHYRSKLNEVYEALPVKKMTPAQAKEAKRRLQIYATMKVEARGQ